MGATIVKADVKISKKIESALEYRTESKGDDQSARCKSITAAIRISRYAS